MPFIQITGILVADCYIDHVDPSLVDYHQVRIEITCRVWNKGFLNNLQLCTFLDNLRSRHVV